MAIHVHKIHVDDYHLNDFIVPYCNKIIKTVKQKREIFQESSTNKGFELQCTLLDI